MDKFISRIVAIIYLTMAMVPIGYMPAALADGNGYLTLCPSGNTQNLFFSKRSSLYETMVNHGAEVNNGKEVKHGTAHRTVELDVRSDHSSHHSSGHSSGHSSKANSDHRAQSGAKVQLHGHHKTHGKALTYNALANIHNGHGEDNNKCSYATVSSGQDFLKFPSLIPFSLTANQLSAATQSALVIIALRLRKQQSRAPPIVTIFS